MYSQVKKHNKGNNVCLPIIITVYGAMDPKFTGWLGTSIDNSPYPEEAKRFNIARFYSKLMRDIWKYNYYCYEQFTARINSAGACDAPLPASM